MLVVASNYIKCKFLGIQHYEFILQKMQKFTLSRDLNTIDELWFLEHYPVYTLGKVGEIKHILDPGIIPIIKSDRGGQVTYHGPGQLIVYFLIDLARKSLGLKQLIRGMLEAIVDLLKFHYGILGSINQDLPGVYIDSNKICSVGLKINKGCSYHGLSLNISMDLEPFNKINPCGVKDLKMVQLKTLQSNPLRSDPESISVLEVGMELKKFILAKLNYTELDE